MRKIRRIIIPIILLVISVSSAAADVNEALYFTNFTYEELHVELFIYDDCCSHVYDLYVWPYKTSLADFWADSLHATYSAYAYGEITGDFYGCISGGITDFNNNIYFDDIGEPYLSAPSDLPTEVYLFENPYDRHDVHVVKTKSHNRASISCFISTIGFR